MVRVGIREVEGVGGRVEGSRIYLLFFEGFIGVFSILILYVCF